MLASKFIRFIQKNNNGGIGNSFIIQISHIKYIYELEVVKFRDTRLIEFTLHTTDGRIINVFHADTAELLAIRLSE